MQLETAKILSRGRIRRTAEEGCERPDVADIVVARLLDEVAHGHVLDHAPAQRADGLLAHRGAPVSRWRLLTPQSSRRDAQLVTASRSPGHCIGATGSVLRAQRTPAKAGSFIDPYETCDGAAISAFLPASSGRPKLPLFLCPLGSN